MENTKYKSLVFSLLLAIPISIGVAICVMLGMGSDSSMGRAVWSYTYFLLITGLVGAFLGSVIYGMLEWLKQ